MPQRIPCLPPAILDGMLAFQATGSLGAALALLAAAAFRKQWKMAKNI